MISIPLMVNEKIWLDKTKYDAAERRYYERLAKSSESAKDSTCSKATEPQEIPGLIQETQVDIVEKIETGPNDLCPFPNQKSTVKSPSIVNVNEGDKTNAKIAEMEVCSDKPISCKLQTNVEEKIISKPVSELPENVRQLITDVCVPPPQICPYPLKTVLIKKETDNDSCSLTQKKEDVCSKPEKSKKSENNKENNVSKVETALQKKIDACEITCPKVKSQAKAKITDDKITKEDLAYDKGNTGLDAVSEIVKGVSQNSNSWNSLAGEVAKARQHIKNSLQCIDEIAVTSNTVSVEITTRLNTLEKENCELKNQVSELVELMKKMDQRITSVEKISAVVSKPSDSKAPAPAPPKKDDAEDDDGVDLFGSDSEEEDTEAAKIKEQRLAEYAARKAKKPVLIAKSNIILDVKPWDDETNMKELEAEVRKVTTDGLVWGVSKLVPLAYGIHKLQISCVVEDEKVSVDWLQETIENIEDYVQSVDIAAFNKV